MKGKLSINHTSLVEFKPMTLGEHVDLVKIYLWCEGGLESGGKDNTKQTNELLLRAL